MGSDFMQDDILYHVHRLGEFDEIWTKDATLQIDDTFEADFYNKLFTIDFLGMKIKEEDDIDYLIARLDEYLQRQDIYTKRDHDIFNMLKCLYFIRREQALEEGRKIFASHAPSRLHSIFLSDSRDLSYWKSHVGADSYRVLSLAVDGNIFMSSDDFFPSPFLLLDRQVEETKKYWRPKTLRKKLRKEYIFQGQVQIIGEE